MNRRTLLKSFLAAPLLSTFPRRVLGFDGSCDPFKFATVKIVLEGPFGVVLKTDSASGKIIVTAFVPAADKNEHDFVFNGVAQSRLTNYHFALSGQQSGLVVPSKPSFIDPGFKDFNPKSRFTDTDDYFVRLDLPCPDRITFVHSPASVTFGDGTSGQLPLNHILIYGVDFNNNGIKMTSKELGDQCASDFDTFSFEVGLARGTPHTVAAAHAKDFYNMKLFPHFQDIPSGKQLGSVALAAASANPAHGAQKGQSSLKSPIKHLRITGERISFWPFTTAVECGSGGVLVDAT